MSSYRAPRIDDINNASWLRTDLQGGPEWAPLLTMLTVKCHSMMGLGSRRDAVETTKQAFSVLLPNLYRSHLVDPNQYVIIDRSGAGYSQSPYNPKTGSRGIRRSVNFLITQGFVEKVGGSHVNGTRNGYISRLRATKTLIDEIDHWLSKSASTDGGTVPITSDTFAPDPHSISSLKNLKVHDLPLIRLKGDPEAEEGGSYIDFDETDATRAMGENLAQINRFIADHWIDLFIPDEQLQQIGRAGARHVDIAGRRSLYRVFNNGSFDQGGRFYGGWWQDVPGDLRRFVTINWHTTAELDYSSMQLNMLYAMEGLAPPADSYALSGFPVEYRKVLKTAFFKLVNATGRMRPLATSDLPQGWTWAKILRGLETLHQPIERHFRSGMGISLQRIDADIAESVMLTLMREGSLALPVHDSFIVVEGRQDRLREVMSQAYFDVMKQRIGITADTTWVEKMIPDEAHELHELGVRFIDDFQADVDQLPEYARYRQRRVDFLAEMGEDWGHRHSFFS